MTATPLALQFYQERIRMVHRNGVFRRRPGRYSLAAWPSRFWFSVCCADISLTLQVQQERIHVVRSGRVAKKRPTDSNGTPAMDLGLMNIILKWFMCVKLRLWMFVVDWGFVIIILQLICFGNSFLPPPFFWVPAVEKTLESWYGTGLWQGPMFTSSRR